MSRKAKQHTKQFKLDAVNYRKDIPILLRLNVPKILELETSTLGKMGSSIQK
ncbi:hypothetical protein [Lachnobacterium bovis]|uniref:hypothetical protein n=1 Tax=Lachnobacterium bovis TaxID=140626 RepID=UPI001FA7992A|nr:hypothetical protein [Lachnobacterium bovis]